MTLDGLIELAVEMLCANDPVELHELPVLRAAVAAGYRRRAERWDPAALAALHPDDAREALKAGMFSEAPLRSARPEQVSPPGLSRVPAPPRFY